MPEWKFDPYTGEPLEEKPEEQPVEKVGDGYWKGNLNGKMPVPPCDDKQDSSSSNVVPITAAIVAGCIIIALMIGLAMSALQFAGALLSEGHHSHQTCQCPHKQAVPKDGKSAVPQSEDKIVITPEDNVGSVGDWMYPAPNGGAKGDWYDPRGEIEFR